MCAVVCGRGLGCGPGECRGEITAGTVLFRSGLKAVLAQIEARRSL